MTGWWLALIAVLIAMLYMAGLFWAAWYGDHGNIRDNKKIRSLLYSFSLAVFCSSWAFFGAVGQVNVDLWSFIPVYIGPALLFFCFWKFLHKLILVSKKESITSIADFIASRHGKSRGLAIMVTLILIIGILPYIALQLKAIVMGFELLTFAGGPELEHQSLALGVTLLLALFVIIFGTRHIDTTEHQHGVMTAIAVESLLKLFAFLLVGGWVCWQVYGVGALEVSHISIAPPESWLHNLVIPTFMAMAAVFCLPRQFHAMVVENCHISDFYQARWLFPLYLLLMSIFVLPLAVAGSVLLAETVPADGYVVALPMLLGSEPMAVLAYIGGGSAGISMVILATISLSTMVSNECLLPLIPGRSDIHGQNRFKFRGRLLIMRRSIILVLLLMAYVVYRAIDAGGNDSSLADLGQMSFAAVLQLMPAVLGGLYLGNSNRKAVSLGLGAGFVIWFYTLMVPLLTRAGWISDSLLTYGLWGISALSPRALFGLPFTGSATGAAMLALFVNSFLYCLGCLYHTPNVLERRQAKAFVDVDIYDTESYQNVKVSLKELQHLVARFVGEQKTQKLLSKQLQQQNKFASKKTLAAAERYLSGVMGAASARVVMKSMLAGGQVDLADVEAIVDETSEVLQFNRELLHGAIENIGQGISVVDRELRLVAWNRRYLEMFDYPESLIVAGRPIADIIRFNAGKGLCGPGDPEEHVHKRVAFMSRGTPHRSECCRKDGRVIDIRGNPMPCGGFVMSFTDITEFRQVEQALKEANESLEQRVKERTRALNELNQQLLEAKTAAESASRSRSRFFAAVSHDLMQPVNAARLFAASLETADQSDDVQRLTRHLKGSLLSVEGLLKDVLDMSRLEAGKLRATIRVFCLADVLEPLASEFRLQAVDEALTFRMAGSDCWVRTDPHLLRRILQNFLTNAFRYCRPEQGRVMLNVRHWPNRRLAIEVRDNGAGIPENKQELIFAEFQRLHRDGQGLGLGLSIARGIADVLHLPLGVRSQAGAGTTFSVQLQAVERQVIRQERVTLPADSLEGLEVLCVDNEGDILQGMSNLLGRWGCQVHCADNFQGALLRTMDCNPDVLLVDYHLDDELNGIELVDRLREVAERIIPAILISDVTHSYYI